MLPHFGPVVLTFSHQQNGQGGNEWLHKVEKRISTKTHNKISDQIKGTMTEVKMSRMRKRSELDEKKTYQYTGRVTVLGVVCQKE